MIEGLKFFRVIFDHGCFGVKGCVAVCAVFTDSECHAGLLHVEAVKVCADIFYITIVPSEIQIISDHIREMVHRTVKSDAVQIGAGGDPSGIKVYGQIAQFSHFIVHVRLVAEHGDFVLDPPETDGRMVQILENQFTELTAGIFKESFAAGQFQHRNFSPHYQAVFVAEIIRMLWMLVVGQPHGVGARFQDQSHIFFLPVAVCRAETAGKILMSGDTVKGQVCAIQEKSPFRMDEGGAETERNGQAVCYMAVYAQFCPEGIKDGG